MTDEAPRYDLSRTSFPFTILATDSLTGKEVWRHQVTGPGRVYVPPLAKQLGRPVNIQLLWPDGTTTEDVYQASKEEGAD